MAALNHSQGMIEGFDLAVYQRTKVLLVGAGGIGTHVALGLIRKGLRQLVLSDDDVVESKNLPRQILFGIDDVGKLKAVSLARRLTREALFPAEIVALPYRFQELVVDRYDFGCVDVIVCGVDNNPTRRAVSIYGLQQRVPVIHAAVARDGNALYVMVQEAGRACWGCALPTYLADQSYPCNLPGIIDVLQVVAGHIVYAVDSLLCGRSREWNLRYCYLDGGLPDRAQLVSRRRGCALCTGYNRWA
jgi:molybdopterin/thiamine biosynthesis adenylyltransferase